MSGYSAMPSFLPRETLSAFHWGHAAHISWWLQEASFFSSWLQFSCESSVVTEPCMANFTIITKPATMPALNRFRIGRHEYSEKVTTIVVQVDDILPAANTNSESSDLFVDKIPHLELKGVPDYFWHQWQQLSNLYPLGIDVFFTCDDVLTALPKIERNKY
jgi:alpha-D-ribose 1-methylphosphonate 5-triphosphate synthase subunit PhnH